jgi:N-acetylglucosaminyl-diphospho-decaprenol L-rhamnosyltransferase
MENALVTLISVAYNSAGALPAFLDGLPKECPLVVVDNGPDDGARALVRTYGGKVVVPPRNIGFGGACNMGAEHAETEFLLFLNPDARLLADSLHVLLQSARDTPNAVAFGPVLVGEDGSVSYKRGSILTGHEALTPEDPGQEDMVVSSLSGAALLVRRDAFRAIGGFDPAIFLYYEDDDISARLRAAGGTLLLVPTAKVVHLSGKSSAPSRALLRFKGYHWTRSRIYVARKYGMSVPWLRGFKNALWHMLTRRVWDEPERLSEGLGRLKGAFSMLGRSS